MTCEIELDYVEYLEEALAEAWELRDSLTANEGRGEEERQWWILKPGMSDRGQGIRLFSTLEGLEGIFAEFEEEEEEEEDGVKVIASDTAANSGNTSATSVITSQLRHFVAQTYIHPPLLIDNRKFHIRAYVLSVGGLKVYVYKPMLALFAANEYRPPWEESTELSGHLTNTCLQTGEREGSVRLFWELSKEMDVEKVWERVQKVVGEVWEAAARGMRVHFQTLPNAFEVFGVDFLVDGKEGVWLLEVNSYPDFGQTGAELGGVVEGLFERVVERVRSFFGEEVVEGGDMVKVLDVELGGW